MNHLYYGDNLDVLGRYVPESSVDLIYLDPPFKSNQDYNILFAEQDGTRSAAQIKAFEDTWQWDQAASTAWQEAVEAGGLVSQAMQAFRTFLGDSDMLAYLAMMAPRLVELRRVLKLHGSIYLHCDPTASHYLKLLMDAVFNPLLFRSEIIWKRTGSYNDARRYADIHDCILYYARSKNPVWNPQHIAHDEHYIRTHYNHRNEEGRLYRLDNIIRSASMGPRPNLVYEYKGYTPPWGWRMKQEKLEAVDEAGRLTWTASGTPYLVRFLDEMFGAAMPSVWEDIPPINSQAQERLHYPTQKPVALLERIITASSNKGDIVLDPFCGCGTAIEAAQKLNRQWIGIDVTHLAISLIKSRLKSAFGDGIEKTYEVIGEPVSLPDAENLARSDPYQFQWWALGLVGARPVEQKKGADKGIDGRLYFHDDRKSGQTKQIIFSVKAGHLTVAHLRDLRGVVEREKAQMGVLISMEEPTKPMKTEAAGAGFYDSPWGSRHPRLQIRTIEELLEGKGVDRPPHDGNVTFKKAPRVYKKQEEQPELL
jgi:site-specific DNA-methyltransferase (adenine-specific)